MQTKCLLAGKLTILTESPHSAKRAQAQWGVRLVFIELAVSPIAHLSVHAGLDFLATDAPIASAAVAGVPVRLVWIRDAPAPMLTWEPVTRQHVSLIDIEPVSRI